MSYEDAFGLIAEFITRRQAVWGPPGVTVAVTDRERTLWADGFGVANIDAQTPVTPQSLFQIGSVGKSFTAFLVMQQVQEGKLGLLRPVKDVLDWFDVKERVRPITVEDLLLHSSGLPTGMEAYEGGLAEALTMMPFDPAFAPGSGAHYSNLGYKLLGFILQRVTGKPYPDLVAERILGPLGMSGSYPKITQDLEALSVPGYRHIFTDRPARAAHPWRTVAFTPSETADGCISSTIEDMATYARVFANGGAFPGGELITPNSFEHMTRPQNMDAVGDRYGFGIWTSERFGRPILEHTGGMIAHRTHMSIDPASGIGLVMLGSASALAIMSEYARGVLTDVANGVPPRPVPSVDARIVPDAEAYRGIWRCGGHQLTITPEGEFLMAETQDGQRGYLEHRWDGVVLAPFSGWDKHLFRPEREGGRIVSLSFGHERFFPAGAEGFLPPISQEFEPMVGLYRTWDPWVQGDIRVFQRGGKLFLQEMDDDCEPMYPGDIESELVAMPGQRVFRVGADELSPDRIAFENLIYGKTQTARYLNCPFSRVNEV